MERSEYYELRESIDIDDLREMISNDYTAELERTVKEKQCYLDTFDFRLYNKGFYLLCDDKSYALHNSHIEKPIATLRRTSSEVHKFWWELPVCSLRDELESSIEVRALIPVMEIEKTTTPVRILNEDQKTVLKLTLENIKAGGGSESSIRHICLHPVKGYKNEHQDFKRRLRELKLERSEGDYLKAALRSVGKDPKDFSSKLNIELSPELSSAEALRIIMGGLLRIIKLNEEGIAKDIDIEFLHDFRVAIRRTRSALTQVKGVFPEDVTKRFKEGFSKFGKMTNLLRDLDIYLQHKDRYRAMLPSELNPGLEHMFKVFGTERKRAHKSIVKSLNSPEYKEITGSWERFLKEPSDNVSPPSAEVPVIDLAKEIIKKKYKQIIKKGGKMDGDTPDSDLHKLRIECKNLRYLLEFFSSLFSEEKISVLIRHLKKLQDNLGEFNDLSVQQARLKGYIDKLESSSDEDRQSIVSSGGLISVLYQRQIEVRSEFSEKFKQFSDAETKSIFRKLFYDRPGS